MTQASARRRLPERARSDRRLGVGIAISVLLHGLLLSLQFGVPGLDLGGGGPISVTLAPSPQPAAPLPDTPPSATPALPVPAPPALPALPAPPAPSRGMRLVDLPPPPTPVAQAEVRPKAQARPPKRAKPPAPKRKLHALAAPVIVAAPDPESEFTVPLPLPDIVPEATPETPALADSVETDPPVPPADVEDVGPDLVAQEEEEARQRQLAEQALEQERLAQAEREAGEARLAQERQAQEAQIAQQREAQRRQAEELASREQAALLRQQEEAERQRSQELAQRQQAEQRAQQLAQQLAREQAEQLARQQAEQLAQQQAAQQARAEAERLAREQADQAASEAAAQRIQAQASGAGAGAAWMDSMPVGPGAGAGRGAGSQPGAGSLAGLPGNRARELLRGVTIPNVAAPATPAERAMGGRRVVADGGERDAPLRLYVDSVRQKLERNAVMGGARLALQDVRIDPLVSLSLRSDGSVDKVTIIRSSGRAEVDDAVRRFVRLNARYSAFPPNVAAQFDVIEIRRIWRFGDGLKLVEEMR